MTYQGSITPPIIGGVYEYPYGYKFRRGGSDVTRVFVVEGVSPGFRFRHDFMCDGCVCEQVDGGPWRVVVEHEKAWATDLTGPLTHPNPSTWSLAS